MPDSGNCAALGYSLESGIPFDMAFVRNHYVGRSFLQPSQLIRDFDVRVKLNLIGDSVRGKRVVVVDDSIVRGTTCRMRVNNLKEAGAKEVHMMISCPPHMHPCVYGIDFPDRSKLLAANHSLEEIRRYPIEKKIFILNCCSTSIFSWEYNIRPPSLTLPIWPEEAMRVDTIVFNRKIEQIPLVLSPFEGGDSVTGFEFIAL